MSWPQRKVSSVVEVRLGRQRSPDRASGPNMVPYLRAANVTDGQLDLTDVKTMDFNPGEQEIFALQPGDVLVTEGSGSLATVGATAVYRGELPGPVCFQNTVLRLRPKAADLDPAFLAWWTRGAYESGTFAAIATGANIHHLGSDGVKSLSIPLPPRSDQRRVTEFLDRDVHRHDEVVGANIRLLNLLSERRVAAVESMVFGDDRTPRARLKHFCQLLQTGPFGSQLHASEYIEGGTPVINPSNLRDGALVADPTNTVGDSTAERLSRHRIQQGDVIFARRGEVGRAGLATGSSAGWLCGTGSLLARVDQDRLLSGYLNLVLALPRTRDWFAEQSVGSTMDNLNTEIVGNLELPVPSVAEQRRVVLNAATLQRTHDLFSEMLTRQNSLLVERRTALITAVVTGQLDLQEAA